MRLVKLLIATLRVAFQAVWNAFTRVHEFHAAATELATEESGTVVGGVPKPKAHSACW
jgi:hypothetical protein